MGLLTDFVLIKFRYAVALRTTLKITGSRMICAHRSGSQEMTSLPPPKESKGRLRETLNRSRPPLKPMLVVL